MPVDKAAMYPCCSCHRRDNEVITGSGEPVHGVDHSLPGGLRCPGAETRSKPSLCCSYVTFQPGIQVRWCGSGHADVLDPVADGEDAPKDWCRPWALSD